LDSLVCLELARRGGISTLPLFVDYGQRNRDRELASLRAGCTEHRFASPVLLDAKGYGSVVKTGLTDPSRPVLEQAFTPGRNLLLIVLAGSVAYYRGARTILLGFLSEETTIFPDQTDRFIGAAEGALSEALGTDMFIACPLRAFVKSEVVALADRIGIKSYYSCHAGGDSPCGHCIACLEYS
jgi:7-cyano-7-deazaguanine synthase